MGNNDSSVETFLQWIKASDNIVFFGGAGVSTESGIPDFRSVDGLYNQKYDYPPEGQEYALSTIMKQCDMWSENS